MNTAQKVRERKEQHPGDYCPVRGCLWRVKHNGRPDTPCQKHPSPESCCDCGMPFNNANPGPNGRCEECNS